jgi:two-component system, LytTR family, response regulator
MKLRCIIVEDEPLALDRARGYILKLPFLELLATFDNGINALVFLRTQPVDIIFLDINMDDFSGIQLLESANVSSQVIITTAYQEYALKGYELSVTDYLLKPYTFDRFYQAVEKARKNLAATRRTAAKKFIFVKTGTRLEKILLRDIVYIEGMDDYRRIHTSGQRIMTLQTFKELETEIPPGIVCRVHRSFMVAIEKIESIEKSEIRIKDMIIPISETYREKFYRLIDKSEKI